MTNTIYIGVPYKLSILPEEGSTFEAVPRAILYQPSSRKYYEATLTAQEDEGYLATWETAGMPTGNYTLEIYDSIEMNAVMKREQNYATAVEVAASVINQASAE